MVAGLPGSGPTPPPAAPPSPLLRLFRTSAADLQAMVDALLSSKEYDALVMDETALDGVDSLNCDTTLVGGAFDTDVQWDRLARLLQAGIDGLDEAVAGRIRPQVMIHLDRGGDNAGARRFLDRLVSRNVPFDVIGLSYYPWWHGSPADLAANLGDLAARYGKDIIVVETAYPWTLAWRDNTHNIIGLPAQLLPAYPATPEGQRGFLAAMLDIVHAVPDGRGIGVFWWGAEWIAAPGFGSSWENLALFDGEGRALPALSAFGADPQKR